MKRTRWLLAASFVVGLGALVGIVLGGAHLLRQMEGRRAERESHSMVQAIHKVARLTTVEMNVSTYELRRDARNLFGFIPIKCHKTVAVFFRGKVAAGFDLHQPGALQVAVTSSPGERRRLRVELPPPRLLYTDAPPPEVLVADGSICNRLEATDYQKLNAEARTALQQQALTSGLLRQAELHARELVQGIAAPFGFDVEVRFRPAPVGSSLSVSRADQLDQ